MRDADYPYEMLYEITVVRSIGAALVGFEKLFDALDGFTN